MTVKVAWTVNHMYNLEESHHTYPTVGSYNFEAMVAADDAALWQTLWPENWEASNPAHARFDLRHNEALPGQGVHHPVMSHNTHVTLLTNHG